MPDRMPTCLLGEIADLTMGQSPESDFVNGHERGLPFLQGCAEFGPRHPLAKVYCDPPQRVARKDSVLISVRAPVGTTNRADQDYCIGRGLAAVKAKPGLAVDDFIHAAIEQNVQFLHRRSQGSTFLAISTGDLHSLPVAAPGPTLQKRIARILNTVDEAIEQTDALIAKMQQIKAGLMHDLFTRGVTEVGLTRPTSDLAPAQFFASPLGPLPAGWSVRPLNSLLANTAVPMRSGPFGSALLKDELVPDGIPFLGIDNVFPEEFVPNYRRFVTRAKFRELRRYAVFPQDVIITIMGTVGRCCVVPDDFEEGLSSKHLWTMTFDVGMVLPRLVCWQLNHAPWVRRWFARQGQGAVMDAISSDTLKRTLIPVPPMDEQHRIASIYDSLQDRLGAEGRSLTQLHALRKGLMADLLSGRVTINANEATP